MDDNPYEAPRVIEDQIRSQETWAMILKVAVAVVYGMLVAIFLVGLWFT